MITTKTYKIEAGADLSGADLSEDTVTITISRALAQDLATAWTPLDDEDNMIELFEACKRALGIEDDDCEVRQVLAAMERSNS